MDDDHLVTTAPRGVVAAASMGAVTLLAARLAVDAWAVAAGPGATSAADVLVAGAAGCAAVLGGWLTLVVLAAGLARLPGAFGRAGAAVARQLAPTALRPLLGTVLGVGMVAAVAPGPAVAESNVGVDGAGPAAEGSRLTGIPPASTSFDPGFRPLPRVPQGLDPGFRPLSSPGLVVVRPGDTLWGLAARRLGGRPSPAQVADAWPRWYEGNRDVIGDDPDLILPGQRLAPPKDAS